MDLRSLRLFLGWSAPLVAAMLTTGCGNYTSEYVPPKDGRARAVWHEDRVVASMPEDANRAGCSTAVSEIQAEPVRYRTYYGGSPTIVIWRPWVVVTSTNTVSTRSRTPATPTSISKGGGSGGSVGNLGSGSSSSGGGGGGGDIGKAAVVLVVVALMTLPIITLGLGLGRPEPSKQVAEEIDKVNAFNDLARLSGSPCAAGEVQ